MLETAMKDFLQARISQLEGLERYLVHQLEDVDKDRGRLHEQSRKDKDIIHEQHVRLQQLSLSESSLRCQLHAMEKSERALYVQCRELEEEVCRLEDQLHQLQVDERRLRERVRGFRLDEKVWLTCETCQGGLTIARRSTDSPTAVKSSAGFQTQLEPSANVDEQADHLRLRVKALEARESALLMKLENHETADVYPQHRLQQAEASAAAAHSRVLELDAISRDLAARLQQAVTEKVALSQLVQQQQQQYGADRQLPVAYHAHDSELQARVQELEQSEQNLRTKVSQLQRSENRLLCRLVEFETVGSQVLETLSPAQRQSLPATLEDCQRRVVFLERQLKATQTDLLAASLGRDSSNGVDDGSEESETMDDTRPRSSPEPEMQLSHDTKSEDQQDGVHRPLFPSASPNSSLLTASQDKARRPHPRVKVQCFGTGPCSPSSLKPGNKAAIGKAANTELDNLYVERPVSPPADINSGSNGQSVGNYPGSRSQSMGNNTGSNSQSTGNNLGSNSLAVDNKPGSTRRSMDNNPRSSSQSLDSSPGRGSNSQSLEDNPWSDGQSLDNDPGSSSLSLNNNVGSNSQSLEDNPWSDGQSLDNDPRSSSQSLDNNVGSNSQSLDDSPGSNSQPLDGNPGSDSQPLNTNSGSNSQSVGNNPGPKCRPLDTNAGSNCHSVDSTSGSNSPSANDSPGSICQSHDNNPVSNSQSMYNDPVDGNKPGSQSQSMDFHSYSNKHSLNCNLNSNSQSMDCNLNPDRQDMGCYPNRKSQTTPESKNQSRDGNTRSENQTLQSGYKAETVPVADKHLIVEFGHHTPQSLEKEDPERGHAGTPAPPSNLRVEREENNSLLLSWQPPALDYRGCSNGFKVVGYRIYLNGRVCQQRHDPRLSSITVQGGRGRRDGSHHLAVQTLAASGHASPRHHLLHRSSAVVSQQS